MLLCKNNIILYLCKILYVNSFNTACASRQAMVDLAKFIILNVPRSIYSEGIAETHNAQAHKQRHTKTQTSIVLWSTIMKSCIGNLTLVILQYSEY